MKYIIIEDEQIAAKRLRELVSSFRPEYEFTAKFDSIEAATISLPALDYDLIFMDIQLADGNSFEIFEHVGISAPIIFTTAYDEYALKAFKHNSIDYLLKPIDLEELKQAILKFEKQANPTSSVMDAQALKGLFGNLKDEGKKRFIIKVGDHLKSIESAQIQLVYSQEKGTYLFTKEGKRYLVDYTLERMEELLSSDVFFRVSRKYIVNHHYIKDMIAFTNSRLELVVPHFDEEQIIVARERVGDFKNWLDR